MVKIGLDALAKGLIAYCQRHDLLPTNMFDLADELQSIASNETYIPKTDLLDWLGGDD